MEHELSYEIKENINRIDQELKLSQKNIFLFGHCAVTLEVIDYLQRKGLKILGILDNSSDKQGRQYRGVMIMKPDNIMKLTTEDSRKESIVLIASRFYAAMNQQLRELGYEGPIQKVVDYNTYAEYSLSDDTITRMKKRKRQGEELLRDSSKKYDGHFKVFCPFNALGDIYIMASYWPAYAQKMNIEQVVFFVSNSVLADVIHMFNDFHVEVCVQKELDAMIQAVIYTRDMNSFIAHQDRPYFINLSKALYKKKISLDQIYCCGVFGLPKDTKPVEPTNWRTWKNLNEIQVGRAVIIAPYAKSVIPIKDEIWTRIVRIYKKRGFQVFTNTGPGEEPLPGTISLRAELSEVKSIVERAGTFIGIRSGLCDVLRTANCRKIALYPDYNYCDTKWKAIDIYWLDEFENIEVKDDVEWEMIK